MVLTRMIDRSLAFSAKMLAALAALLVLSAHEQGRAATSFGDAVAAGAVARTQLDIVYDPNYRALTYPGGDIANNRGVCTDLVIRAFRAAGADLQALVHEDITRAFDAYPKLWGARKPDHNIDHRRAPNLEVFFTRMGARLAASDQPSDYKPGDVVAWNLRGEAGFLPHIGVVLEAVGPSGWPLIAHNIGAGPVVEDVLFAWPITGRYRVTKDLLARR